MQSVCLKLTRWNKRHSFASCLKLKTSDAAMEGQTGSSDKTVLEHLFPVCAHG